MQLPFEQTKSRILVADDDPVIRHLVCSIVKSEGCEVVVAENGRDALKILQTDTNFRGAIFDMMMPFVEGIDIIRHMKTEKRFMRIPIMMMTSEQDFRLAGKLFAAGAALFLRKPFTSAQMKNMLHTLLSQSRLFDVSPNSNSRRI